VLAKLSNRDLIPYDEKHLKAVILTLLHVDGLYLIESECEAESGYVDIVLKYLSEGKRHLLEQTQAEAQVQLQRYLGEKLEGRIKPERLRTATLVVIGKSDVVGVCNGAWTSPCRAVAGSVRRRRRNCTPAVWGGRRASRR
jgi:hypothetical protein